MTRRLLAILAHPDDESFGPGGALARYAAEGIDVHVAIATDGAAGSVVEAFADARDDLAAIRARELDAAVAILGVTLHRLGYRDSGYVGDPAHEHPKALIQADKREATGRVVALIRTVRPHVILTHDENGGYFHPDHIFCNQITLCAFEAAGDPKQFPEIGPAPYNPERLYYTAYASRLFQLRLWMMRLRGEDPTRAGRNKDIDLTRIMVDPALVTTRVDIRPVWQKKRSASAAHASQGGGRFFNMRLPQWLLRQLFGRETYRRVIPPAPAGYKEEGFFT